MGFVRIIKTRTVPEGKGAVKILNGVPIAIFNVNGEYKAYVAVCPHKFHVLCVRELVKGKIMCQGHGELFDPMTGEPTVGKAKEPLREIEVRVENGDIYVKAPDKNLIEWLYNKTKKE